MRVLAGFQRFGGEVGGGRGEVVVAEAVRAGTQLQIGGPFPHMVLDGALLGLAEIERQRPAGHAVGIGVVGQHQRVLAILVGEVVIDAELLHQPRDEIERAFAVLHAVFQNRAAGLVLPLVLDCGKPVILEHGVDDVPGGLLLIDLAILRAGEQPDPGPQLDMVAIGAAAEPGEAGAGQDAVEIGLGLVGIGHGDGDRTAQRSLDVAARLAARQIQLDQERPAQLLGGVHAVEGQRETRVGRDSDRDIVAAARRRAAALRHLGFPSMRHRRHAVCHRLGRPCCDAHHSPRFTKRKDSGTSAARPA